jgi:D-amino-acid dehydrogenase
MKITVIGAGIVGICCASYLQRDGHQVTVLDPVAPGGNCSFGNSGSIAPGSCIPLSLPGVIRKVPSWLLDPEGPLRVDWRYLPTALPWLLGFIRAGKPANAMAAASALRALHKGTFDNYMPLLQAIPGGESLVRRPGQIYVYETEESFQHDQGVLDIRRRHGVEMEILTGDAARAMEPSLSPLIRHAVFFPEAGHCLNPERIVQVLAGEVERRGGIVKRERVVEFERGEQGLKSLRTEAGSYPVDAVVVAAGAWSGKLAGQLGQNIPVETLRGYHVVFRDPGIETKMSILSVTGKFSATPMEMGLRCGGTIEIAGFDKKPDYGRADIIARQAKRLFPGLRTEPTTHWMGHRPGTPDSVPVIDRATHVPNVYYAFGHGQTGLIGASTTGRLIAELVGGRKPVIDLAPYRASRFG